LTEPSIFILKLSSTELKFSILGFAIRSSNCTFNLENWSCICPNLSLDKDSKPFAETSTSAPKKPVLSKENFAKVAVSELTSFINSLDNFSACYIAVL